MFVFILFILYPVTDLVWWRTYMMVYDEVPGKIECNI